MSRTVRQVKSCAHAISGAGNRVPGTKTQLNAPGFRAINAMPVSLKVEIAVSRVTRSPARRLRTPLLRVIRSYLQWRTTWAIGSTRQHIAQRPIKTSIFILRMCVNIEWRSWRMPGFLDGSSWPFVQICVRKQFQGNIRCHILACLSRSAFRCT